jgi:cytochrome c-type biogenesis protein CcmH
MKAFLIVLLLFDLTSLNNIQKAEVRKIDERLLAPCCYTQSIAVHRSEIARQMRAEVAEMVVEGRTEEEIVNHYKGIYGERILIVPEGITGRILFSLPFVTSVLASVILFVSVRKMLRSGKNKSRLAQMQTPSVINKSLREKIERELGEGF